MAHAIYGYPGSCKKIHGHSYELHVTLSNNSNKEEYLPAPGLILDFKELKNLVLASVIEMVDHKLILSRSFLSENPELHSQENLVIWEAEPTAENMLIFIQRVLQNKFPANIILAELKLFETKNSYVRWINSGN